MDWVQNGDTIGCNVGFVGNVGLTFGTNSLTLASQICII